MQSGVSADTLGGGFTNPPIDAAFAFRGIMQAMAQPGTIHVLSGAAPPEPLSLAAGATILTLCDTDTEVYLAGRYNCAEVRSWIRFHTGAPITDAGSCRFAIGAWTDLLPVSDYSTGTSEYPDRSATLIVEAEGLTQAGFTLKGPGIHRTAMLSLPELDVFTANNALYPLGLDFIFTCCTRIAALPRSIEVSVSDQLETR
jgi:alpha-D-ribose 1-methylphosphonate 5-triphosphate synthase subunit PhnH